MNEETNDLAEEIIKGKEAEILELKAELLAAKNEIVGMKSRSLKVYEENNQLKSSPEVAKQKADMEYMLSMADRFIRSGAFKVANAEQAYTIMKAGKEMGLSEVESLNALYIVNGTINPYGKHMVAMITKMGYKLEYLDETDKSVKVRCYNDQGFDVTETVRDTDQILLKSKAMSFAKKNKMRFHGIRMLINFHLAHHFGSVSDMMAEEFKEVEDSLKPYEIQQMIETIESFETIEELEAYYEENKTKISRDLNATMQVGIMRKKLSIEEAEIISQ